MGRTVVCIMGALMKFFLVGTFAACSLASAAHAEPDQCKDVLINGTFQYSAYKNNTYFLQILYSRFVSSTFESSKSDTSLGMGIPLGEAVMGSLNYDQDQYNAMKRSIDQTKFKRVEMRNELSTMLSSGDPGVLSAWTQCIVKHGGGLSVRFEPLSARQARVVIEYNSQGTQHWARLASHVAIKGIATEHISNPECFKRKRKIVAGSPCRSTINLPDAVTPLSIDVNAEQGSASAFLPARIRLVEQRERVPVDELYGEYFRRGNVREVRSHSISPDDQKAGWMLASANSRHSVGKVFDNGRNNNSCYDSFANVSPYAVEYGYNVVSHTRGHGGWTVGCRGTYYVERFRRVWEPDENSPLVSAPTT